MLLAVATVTWPQVVKEWANWAVTPETLRLIGLAGVIVGLAYWCLLLWLRQSEPSVAVASPTVDQKTKGDGSHNINNSTVVITPAHEGGIPWLTSSRRAQAAKRPEMQISEAIAYISGVIGDKDPEHCYRRTRREVRQAACDGRIEIWGRAELPQEAKTDPEEASEIWTPIDAEYWRHFKLTEMATGELFQDREHTSPDPFVAERAKQRYWALRVDQSAIRREWYKRENPRRIKYPRGPQDWMR